MNFCYLALRFYINNKLGEALQCPVAAAAFSISASAAAGAMILLQVSAAEREG